MKSRTQKQEELKRGKELLDKSQVLVFTDFTKVKAEDLRRMRRELNKVGANFLVIKKRLLALLLKERKVDFDTKQFKLSIGTIFSEGDMEKISGPVYKFFSALEISEGKEKDMWIKHILGGYDLKNKNLIDALEVVTIGKLPPREVLLGQLLGTLVAPLRSFMYILSEKSKVAAK